MLDPQTRGLMALQRVDDLRLDRHRRARPKPAPTPDESVSLRLCTVHDDPELERLAALEGRPLPAGRFVLAEVGGRVVAAQPLAGGPPLADPFRPTAHLLPLLHLRAAQLAEPREARRVPLPWRRSAFRSV